MNSGCYVFCFPNNKHYVGKTINLENRLEKYNRGGTRYVDKAISKYGFQNVEVLFFRFSEDELNLKERELIQQFNSLFPTGYNLTEGGEGGKQTEEAKKNTSYVITEKWKDDNYREAQALARANKDKDCYSRAMKTRWENEEYRNQRSEQVRKQMTGKPSPNAGMKWVKDPISGKRVYFKPECSEI